MRYTSGPRPPLHVVRLAASGLGLLLACLAGTSRLAAAASLELTIPSDTVSLAATLYVPEENSRRLGVVILHGSGDWDRHAPIPRRMIDCLLEAGLVVLDFDKRGIGGSTGTYSDNINLEERAVDAAAAIRMLRARPEVDRVGLWGVSQGGWVGTMIAARDPDLAFAILVSSPGVSPVEQMLYQRMERLRDEGWTDAEVEEAWPLRRLLWDYYRTGEGRDELERSWSAARARPWFPKLNWGEQPPTRDALNSGQRSFYQVTGIYDPVPDLERISTPLLCFFGAKDRHIPVEASIAALRGALGRNPGARATIELLPEAGHGMQIVAGSRENLKEMEAIHQTGATSHGASLPQFLLDPEYCHRLRRWLDRAALGSKHAGE